LRPFWTTKRLDEMTHAEWESLCDRCGRCCLKKVQDGDAGRVAYTDVACRLLDRERCRCKRYADRQALVADCVTLSPANLRAIPWLPVTCAYRRLAEGRPLAWWHPLVSGDPDSVHRAGISVRGRTLPERAVPDSELPSRIVHWLRHGRSRARAR
jgi:uncharacterized protein